MMKTSKVSNNIIRCPFRNILVATNIKDFNKDFNSRKRDERIKIYMYLTRIKNEIDISDKIRNIDNMTQCFTMGEIKKIVENVYNC